MAHPASPTWPTNPFGQPLPQCIDCGDPIEKCIWPGPRDLACHEADLLPPDPNDPAEYGGDDGPLHDY
jgi:hypothetical protein